MCSEDLRRLIQCCTGGDSTAVKRIVEACPEFVREVNEDGDTCFHIAVLHGNLSVVKYLFKWLKENPMFSDVICLKNRRGNTVLHLALSSELVARNQKACCVTVVKAITSSYANLCFSKDNDGQTPFHVAAMLGSAAIMKRLLDSCPEAVKVLSSSGKTCFHIAVEYENGNVVTCLLNWILKNNSYCNLINFRDGDGKTALHLAIAGRKIQILKSLLACDLVDVDVLCSDGPRHLYILLSFLTDGTIEEYTFPKVDSAIAKFLATRITNTEQYRTSRTKNRARGPSQVNAHNILLVTAIVFAALTFHAATIYPFSIAKRTHTQNEGDMITTRSFIFYNSACFVASVTSMVYLLHEMPLKPWPQVMVFTFYASYMFMIMAISRPEAVIVFFLSIPLLMSTAAGKLFQFMA